MCSSTAASMADRSPSSPTLVMVVAGASEAGMASSRSICSMARRTGMTAAVRPSATPSASVLMYCSISFGYPR